MANLPSRWYRNLSTKSDISDFVEHLRELGQFGIREREYPGQIQISGEAYYLIRVIYEAEKNRLKSFVIGLFTGNKYLQIAKGFGRLFVEYISNASDTTTDNIKYINSVYMLMSNDNGSSATLNYCDAFSMDNPNWEPKGTY